MNFTCNSTLEELRILPTSEREIVGSLTFHKLALIIAGASTIVAIILSFYLIWMHALHYTKPREQKHIIRILFMVPVYAASSFLQLWFYWHAVYYQVISDCYEAFAIASFFALLCHYIAPDLHEQKEFFRYMRPVKGWVWPVSWFKACCCGERGPWRTPLSGLTWFNIIWIGIYHYCFIRVAMTITAVVTQYFGRYCESSNSPVFSHIWVIAIECVAVTIAMYCIIQFYVQLREPLAEHKPFLKVLSIKLVIFLAFWQTIAISVGTSDRVNIVHPNDILAYPDIKVGIPSLLLCFEMACFAALHLWAFPYRPYLEASPKTYYPVPDPSTGAIPRENERGLRKGGPAGFLAIADAMNLWDVVKAFGRGIRWLFCGVKRRKEDVSYKAARGGGPHLVGDGDGDDMVDLAKKHGDASYAMTTYSSYDESMGVPGGGGGSSVAAGAVGPNNDRLPIAHEFRRSNFGLPPQPGDRMPGEERVGLIDNAQPNPEASSSGRGSSNPAAAAAAAAAGGVPLGRTSTSTSAGSSELHYGQPQFRAVSPYHDYAPGAAVPPPAMPTQAYPPQPQQPQQPQQQQQFRYSQASDAPSSIVSGPHPGTRFDAGGRMGRLREEEWEDVGGVGMPQAHAYGGVNDGGDGGYGYGGAAAYGRQQQPNR